MNKLKRTLALMAALAMTATAFVGCGGNESSSSSESKAESSAEDSSEADADSAEDSTAEEESSVESAAGYTNVDVPALGEPDGSLKDGGDKLTILCWNDDDLKYMYDIVADATGMDKSMINYKNVGSNGTDANEQYAQVFLSGDDVDLYFCDADWNMAYQNNDEYSAPLSAVGISEDMYANAYDYTVAMGKDKNGVLKGASWQAAAGGYAYRADLAEEYLGVTSPEDMQAQVGSWDDFWKTAATVYEKSGNTTAMADSLGGVWRAYSNGNRTKSWVNDGKLDPSSVGDFISMAKENFDKGYISGATQWSDDWLPQGQSDGAQANKTFGFFFPTWAIAKGGSLEQAEGGEGGSTYGKYALCEGPTSWFWGGTWICVYPKTDNAKEAGQFIYTMTADADAMQKYVDVRGDFVNNKGVMSATTEAGTNSNPLFGGQDQFQIAGGINPALDMDDVGILEQPHHMRHGIHVADVSEKLVAESLAFARAFHEPGDVDKLHRRGNDFCGVFQFCKIIQPLVGNRNDARVRFDRAERKVRRHGAALAQRIEKG